MIRNIYILLLLSLSFGATEPRTGWSFDSSPYQSFYMFDEITIDGDVVVGDGSGTVPYTHRTLPTICSV